MSYLAEWRPSLRLQPSRRIRFGLALLHLSCLLSLSLLALPISWAGLVMVLVLLNWRLTQSRFGGLCARQSVTRIVWSSDGWMLEDQNTIHGPYVLAQRSRITRHLVLLHFKKSSDVWRTRMFVPIASDSLESDEFHKLQIFLRWQRPQILNPALFPAVDERDPDTV